MVLVAGSVATASTDGTRLVTGTTTKTCGPACGLADGPFVLTDARALDFTTLNVTWFYTVPAGADCTVTCVSQTVGSTTVDVQALVALSTVAPTASGKRPPSEMVGARYFIPSGRRLCVCNANSTSSPFASWSGYVPYQ
jgi:hypothetical protein